MSSRHFTLFALGVALTAPVGRGQVDPQTPPANPEAPGEPPTPLLAFHFDEGTEGWRSADQISLATVTAAREHLQAGDGALEFTYILPRPEQLQKGKIPPVLLGPLQADLKSLRALRFWWRTDQPAAILVLLMEADGSNYNALFYSPGETWQHVALSLDRFQLADDSNDENGQLDPDQINAVGFLDASFFLSVLTQQPVEREDRQFWLDELELLPSEVPSSYHLDREEIDHVVLDDFESGFLSWLPVCGDLSLEEDHPPEPEQAEKSLPPNQHSMLWEHEGPTGQLVGLIRPFHLPPLKGFTQLRLWVKASEATTLIVSLEEMPDRTGEKSSYYQAFPVQPGEWQEVILPWKQFTLEEKKQDDNGQLDLNEVETMFLADAGAMLGQTPKASIWVDGMVLE